MNNYKILVYHIDVEDGGYINKVDEDETHSKKEAVQIYEGLKVFYKSDNYFFWSTENEYNEIEYLIYTRILK